MPQYAIVFNGVAEKFREYPSQPPCKMIDGKPTVRPVVKPALGENQVYDGFVVYDDRVEYVIRDLSAQEIAAKDQDSLNKAILTAEAAGGRLFFRLCKVLIDNAVIDPLDPGMADIKDAYQNWKTLKGL